MGDDDIIVKLDFTNVFNTRQRDTLMETIAKQFPEIYFFVHAAYAGEPIALFVNHIIPSLEGPQRGDPLVSLEFCCSFHPLLNILEAELRLGFMDDIPLFGTYTIVAVDVNIIK